jgi:hypothetical protein
MSAIALRCSGSCGMARPPSKKRTTKRPWIGAIGEKLRQNSTKSCLRGSIVADNAARKAQYLYHSQHGLSDRAIAKRMRINAATLLRWKNRHLPEPVKLVPTAVGNRVRLMPIGHHLDSN